MKKRIIFIVFAVFILANYFCISSTYAWFITDDGIAEGGQLNAAIVNYIMHGEMIADTEIDENGSEITKFIVPGDDLLYEDIYFENRSSVKSRLMIKMQYRVSSGEYYPIIKNDPYFDISFPTGAESDWYFDNTLGGWCYGSVPGGVDIEPLNQNIYFIDKLRLREEFGNADAGKNVFIRIIYLARQAEYMNWTSIGEDYYTLGTIE